MSPLIDRRIEACPRSLLVLRRNPQVVAVLRRSEHVRRAEIKIRVYEARIGNFQTALRGARRRCFSETAIESRTLLAQSILGYSELIGTARMCLLWQN